MNQSEAPSDPSQPRPIIKKLGIFETIEHILRKDGLAAFWRGIGPALVLVINPIIQYTFFEQFKNFLVKRRLASLRAGGPAVTAGAAVLSDWDFFFLGALSKLSKSVTSTILDRVVTRLASSRHLLNLPLYVSDVFTICKYIIIIPIQCRQE